MTLQLNKPTDDYKEFFGRNIDQMPLLIGDGRVPLSVSGLMQKRLSVLNSDASVSESWWNYYFDTGDVILYHPDGKVLLLHDSDMARELTPESELLNGAFVLPDGYYGAMLQHGLELTKSEVKKYSGSQLTRQEAKGNPFWRFFARNDKLLNGDLDALKGSAEHKGYVDVAFEIAKQRFGYDKNMGIYIAQPQKVPVGRLWCVGGINNYSDADGNYGLVILMVVLSG